MQCGLLPGVDEAERAEINMPRLLLRRQPRVRRVLRRDRHHGGEHVRVPLDLAHLARPRGCRRRLRRRRRWLERPARLHAGALRTRGEVRRHGEAVQGRRLLPDRRAGHAAVDGRRGVAGGQRVLRAPVGRRLQGQRPADPVPRPRHDAGPQLLERQGHALDGRRRRRRPGPLQAGRARHVRREGLHVRFPHRRLGHRTCRPRPQLGARADGGPEPVDLCRRDDDDRDYHGPLLDHQEGELPFVAVLQGPRHAVL
mmetsp:Transcript_71238/g.218290  ORF Transcript_71238/g.218290 Transcript_71238/m.218290 type:complete len:255 (-) Transcript_71238:57-821(-)